MLVVVAEIDNVERQYILWIWLPLLCALMLRGSAKGRCRDADRMTAEQFNLMLV